MEPNCQYNDIFAKVYFWLGTACQVSHVALGPMVNIQDHHLNEEIKRGQRKHHCKPSLQFDCFHLQMRVYDLDTLLTKMPIDVLTIFILFQLYILLSDRNLSVCAIYSRKLERNLGVRCSDLDLTSKCHSHSQNCIYYRIQAVFYQWVKLAGHFGISIQKYSQGRLYD